MTWHAACVSRDGGRVKGFSAGSFVCGNLKNEMAFIYNCNKVHGTTPFAKIE